MNADISYTGQHLCAKEGLTGQVVNNRSKNRWRLFYIYGGDVKEVRNQHRHLHKQPLSQTDGDVTHIAQVLPNYSGSEGFEEVYSNPRSSTTYLRLGDTSQLLLTSPCQYFDVRHKSSSCHISTPVLIHYCFIM